MAPLLRFPSTKGIKSGISILAFLALTASAAVQAQLNKSGGKPATICVVPIQKGHDDISPFMPHKIQGQLRAAVSGLKGFQLLEIKFDQKGASKAIAMKSHPQGQLGGAVKTVYEGNEKFKQQSYEEALSFFRRAVAKYENSVAHLTNFTPMVDAMIKLGISYLQTGEEESGEDVLRRALALRPELKLDPKTYPPLFRRMITRIAKRLLRKKRGKLKVASNTNGTTIFVNGVKKGAAPLTVRNLVAGRHYIRAEAPGYAPQSMIVEVKKGGVAKATLVLKKGVEKSKRAVFVSQLIDALSKGQMTIPVKARVYELALRVNADYVLVGYILPKDRKFELRTFLFQKENNRIVALLPQGLSSSLSGLGGAVKEIGNGIARLQSSFPSQDLFTALITPKAEKPPIEIDVSSPSLTRTSKPLVKLATSRPALSADSTKTAVPLGRRVYPVDPVSRTGKSDYHGVPKVSMKKAEDMLEKDELAQLDRDRRKDAYNRSRERDELRRRQAEKERERRRLGEIARERRERDRLERERLERDRLERERLEQDRLKRRNLERNRLERDRLVQDRLKREGLDRARLKRERKAREKLARERRERERLEARRRRYRERLKKAAVVVAPATTAKEYDRRDTHGKDDYRRDRRDDYRSDRKDRDYRDGNEKDRYRRDDYTGKKDRRDYRDDRYRRDYRDDRYRRDRKRREDTKAAMLTRGRRDDLLPRKWDMKRNLGENPIGTTEISKPVYKKWWFWTIIGSLVASGTGVGIYFMTRGSSQNATISASWPRN